MSFSDAQLLRAIASSPARPRTVLNAGHSKTALSVYSAAYAPGSRSRYAWTTRAFSESTAALASLADDRGAGEHATPDAKSEMMATPMDVFTVRTPCRWSTGKLSWLPSGGPCHPRHVELH